MKMPFDEAMRVKDQMPKGLFRNVDGQTADTIWLCAIDAAEQYHGIPRKPLTQEEIGRVWHDNGAGIKLSRFSSIARAVEQAHGIKE